MKNDSKVDIVKIYEPFSKQIDDQISSIGTRPPKFPFRTLVKIYNDSFIVKGLSDKISTAIASGFVSENEELVELLQTIDQEFLYKNFAVCGNAFFEVIRDGTGKITELLPVLSETIEILESGEGYKQMVGAKTSYFNKFTPINQRAEAVARYTQTGAGGNELISDDRLGSGFNPNLNEIYQFQNTSLSTKYYGDSFFESAFNQITLIKYIDDYYNKYFDDGLIKSQFIYPKGEKKSFSKTEKETLKHFLTSKVKGNDKAFSTAVLDMEIGALNLESDINTKDFLDYRTDLLKSIAVALNIPYDMLLSDNSNRATSQTSKESFNEYTIKPLQSKLIKDFVKIFSDDFDTSDLQYRDIDTKDQKEEMEVFVGYKKAGIVTANEVREKLGFGKIDGGDELVVDAQKQQVDFIKTLNEVENDFKQGL